MTQNEFLDILKKALNGQVSPETVSENLAYYRSYISDEQQKGRSESEILEELGDPRLIARTILDAESGNFQKASKHTSDYENYEYSYQDSFETSDHDIEDPSDSFRSGRFRLNKWAVFGILFLILFLICSILFFAFKTVFRLLFSFHGLWFWIIVLLIIYSLSKRK